MLPAGNSEFTREMGCWSSGRGRGWISEAGVIPCMSSYVGDGRIRKLFAEPGFSDNLPGAPVEVSGAETMLKWLKSR